MTSPAWLVDVARDRLLDETDPESWQTALGRVQDALRALADDLAGEEDPVVLEARQEALRAASGIGNARARLLVSGRLILSRS